MAQIPQARPRRHGGPFDDPFFQNFFNDPFQMMSPPQQITIRGDPIELAIKPLPSAGQPRSFSGAVGNFSMTTNVKPTMVEAGDPLTITAKITGNGDFDRVTAPQITDPAGWKTYPPSSKFEADDDVGISGVKTFEMAAIPSPDKKASPSLEWSYFDPAKEQYVTLDSQGTPIRIEGQAPAAPTPVGVQQTAQATPAPTAPDILYIRADSAGWGRTFTPIYTTPIFWEAQGMPLIALLALIGVQIARKRAADQEARRRDQWRRQKEAEVATIQRRDIPEGEAYQAAARALRLEAAIQLGREPETLDGAEVAGARVLDDALAERVRQLFDRQDEVLYAGVAGGRTASSAQTRIDLLETVKGYENAKPAA
jgi:heme exporter protein D